MCYLMYLRFLIIMLLVYGLTESSKCADINNVSKVPSAQQATKQSRFDEFMHIINTGNAYQRERATSSLIQIADPRIVPVLINLLRDDDADNVRVYAAQQLDRLADKRSTQALADALSDTNENVRRYAAKGLAKIGSEKHVPALVKAVINNLPDQNQADFSNWYSRR